MTNSSFSTIFNPGLPPAPGQTNVTSPTDPNSQVTPTIDTTVTSSPYSFILGTTGGANDPGTLTVGSNAIFPTDDGNPEYSLSVADSLGSAATTDPADLDPATFQSWSSAQQAAYLALWNATSALIGTDINGGASAVYASLTSAGGVTVETLAQYATATLNAADTPLSQTAQSALLDPLGLSAYVGVAPSDLSPSVWSGWTPGQQDAYLEANNNGTLPSSQVIGSGADPADAIVVSLLGGAGTSVTQNLAVWGQNQAPTVNLGESLNASVESAPVDLGAYGAVAPTNLNPNIFSDWTSEQQAEYLNYWLPSLEAQYGGNLATYNADVVTPLGVDPITQWSQAAFAIGSSVAGATPIDAVLSSTNPDQVYIVNNLTVTDIGEMSATDQAAVAAAPSFQQVASDLQLSTNTSASLQTIQSDINSIVGTPTSLAPTTLYLTPAGATTTTTPPVTSPPAVGVSVVANSATSFTYTVTEADGGGDVQQTILTVDTSTDTGTLSTTLWTASGSSYQMFGQSSSVNVVASPPPSGNYVSLSVAPGSSAVAATATSAAVGSFSSDVTFTDGQSYNGPSPFILVSSGATETIANIVSVPIPGSNATIAVNGMPDADRQIFIDELNILYSQISSSSIVNPTQISTDVQAVMQRFTTAATYYSDYNSQPSSTTANGTGVSPLYANVVSTDNNASIKSTYNTLIQQESVILSSMQSEAALATPAEEASPALDAPTAAMLALTASMNSQQAIITQGTTQLSAIQDFLQDVSAMQNLVNQTVQTFGSNSTATGGFIGATTPAELSSNPNSQVASLVEMFDSTLNDSGNDVSPILAQFGIQMPTINILNPSNPSGNLNGLTSQEWSNIGTQLSNLVTQLQQQAQTLTTSVNQETQQLNNTYTEMTGIVGQMGTVEDTIGTDMA